MPDRIALVTGGTGFTGSHLVRRLLDRGMIVRVLDNQRGPFHAELSALGAQIALGSVEDASLVSSLVQGCHVIYHLAAAFRKVNLPERIYWSVNVEGTRNVLEAAVQHSVPKVVFCSTCGVHGNVERPPADEDSPIAPADYYQYTKYEGEKVALEFAQRGLDVTMLRPAAIYGPGDPGRWLYLIRLASKGRFFMFGDGKTTYHPLYIDSLVDAFELAAKPGIGTGRAYLIADETALSLNAIVSTIGEAMGRPVRIRHVPFWPLYGLAVVVETLYKPLSAEPPLFRRRVDWFRQNRSFDITRAKEELGYSPTIDLAEGLRRTATWYRENGYL